MSVQTTAAVLSGFDAGFSWNANLRGLSKFGKYQGWIPELLKHAEWKQENWVNTY